MDILILGTDGQEEFTPITTSAGAADANKVIQTDSTGKVDESILPDGIGADVESCTASEALSAGNLVNIYDNGGTLSCRKADASGGRAKAADGFVKAAVSSGQTASVYRTGTVTGLTGLTVGAEYWLSGTTAGGVQLPPIPTATGYIAQSVGKAKSATELMFVRGTPTVRA